MRIHPPSHLHFRSTRTCVPTCRTRARWRPHVIFSPSALQVFIMQQIHTLRCLARRIAAPRQTARVKTSIRIRLSKNCRLVRFGPLRDFFMSGIGSFDLFQLALAFALARSLQRVGSLWSGGESRPHVRAVKSRLVAILFCRPSTPSPSCTCAI